MHAEECAALGGVEGGQLGGTSKGGGSDGEEGGGEGEGEGSRGGGGSAGGADGSDPMFAIGTRPRSYNRYVCQHGADSLVSRNLKNGYCSFVSIKHGRLGVFYPPLTTTCAVLCCKKQEQTVRRYSVPFPFLAPLSLYLLCTISISARGRASAWACAPLSESGLRRSRVLSLCEPTL